MSYHHRRRRLQLWVRSREGGRQRGRGDREAPETPGNTQVWMENKYLVILNVIHDKRYDSFKGRNCLYDMIADVELKIITLKVKDSSNSESPHKHRRRIPSNKLDKKELKTCLKK